ncbi:MAG: radical SAM protein [Candidatus Helarchaeota archaeon]
MKNYFKKHVELVEVEVFSYCNRQCWHCPNSIIDRHSGNTYMSDFVYNKILKNLKQIEYDKIFSFCRYNEPLADSIIYKKIAEAHQKLPNACMHLNTNGDFLTPENLQKLYESGLRSLNIQVYSQDDKQIYKKIFKWFDKLNLIYVTDEIIHRTRIEYRSIYGNENDLMAIRIYYRNFYKVGVNRGGILKCLTNKKTRIAPCSMPKKWVCIDYNGSVMPCCNLRSDWEEHKKFVLGNLNKRNRNLFNIFSDKKAIKFRELMDSPKLKPYPCNICHFAENSQWRKENE